MNGCCGNFGMGDTTTNAVLSFKPMIRMIAARLAATLPPGTVLDDLMQEGMIGLIEAVRQCRNRDERFTAYAYQRIQGAMVDSLRAIDTAPRRARPLARQAHAAVAALEQKLGRRPFESEIAAEMGMQLSDYQRLLFDIYSSRLLYFDPTDHAYGEVFSVIDEHAEPAAGLEQRQLIAAIDWAIDGLPERGNRVITEIYLRGRSARDVAKELALSEGRVSQIRAESLEMIRSQLRRRGLIPE